MLEWDLLFPLSLLLIRWLAGYDSRCQRGKAFPIGNRVLRAVLLDRHRLFEHVPRPNRDLTYMCLPGLLYYLGAAVTAIVIVVCKLTPAIPVVTATHGTCLFTGAASFNTELCNAAAVLLFAAVAAYLVVRAATIILREVDCKWLRYIFFTVCMFAVAVALALIVFVPIDLARHLLP